MYLSLQANPGGMINALRINAQGIFVDADDPQIRAALKEAARVYMRYIRERYMSASAGDGTWAPLAIPRQATKLSPRSRSWGRLAVHTGILIRTGRLFSSMFGGDGENIEQIDDEGITVGSAVPYAKYHQFGTSRMPAREIFVEPPLAVRQEMKRVIQQAVNVVAEELEGTEMEGLDS